MEKELPKNWVETDLDTILVRITNGSSLKQREEFFDGAYPISRIETIADENFDLNRVKYVLPTQADIEKFALKKYDILFSHINSDKHLGKTALFDLDITLIHGINLLLLRTVEQYNPKLLNFLFRHYRYSGKFMEVAQRAVNQSSINQKKLKRFPIPLPPREEQDRIVAKLDLLFGQLDTINESVEKIPVLLKNFRQQVLTQAMTGKLTKEWRKGKEIEEWKKIPLGKLLVNTPKNGAYYPKSQYGDGVRIIRIDAFYEGNLKYWEKVQKVKISHKDYETYCLQEGDILINRVNSIEYLGKCMLVENLQEPAIFESNMMRLTIDEAKAVPSFLRYFLTSHIGKRELRKNAKHAVNQASINQTDVKAVLVNIPGLEEQKKVVGIINSLLSKADTLETNYHLLRNKIEHLPQAILHKAFKGELVPQLEGDGDARDLLKEITNLH